MIPAERSDLSDTIRSDYQLRYPALADKIQRFDPKIYLAENPDVAEAARSPEELIKHFCEFGHRECRRYAEETTYAALFAEAFPRLAAKLQNFDPIAYAAANRDVGSPERTARALFEHYCLSGADELRVKRDDGRIPDRRDAIRRVTGRPTEDDIRVYAHVFLPTVGRALSPYLRNLAAIGGRLALSFSEATFSLQDMERFTTTVSAEDSVDADFVATPSEGRDWEGFTRLWTNFPPADDSVVFLLHSKQSLHMASVVGEMWRNELLDPLCGSYGAILNAIEKIRSGHSMVGAALHRSRNVGPNRELIREIAPLLGLAGDIESLDFVAGTMFAVEGRVLNSFYRSIGSGIDFRRKGTAASRFDGSMAHAFERLIGYYAAGFGKGIAWVI